MKRKIINSFLVLIFITSGISYAASLTVESDKQEFKDTDKKIYLEGNVKVKTGDVNVLSPRAVVEVDPKNNKVNKVEFKENAYSYQLKDGKKHEIKAQILEMSLLNKVLSPKEFSCLKQYNLSYRNSNEFNLMAIYAFDDYGLYYSFSNELGFTKVSPAIISNLLKNGWKTNSKSIQEIFDKPEQDKINRQK